jgi:transketolase
MIHLPRHFTAQTALRDGVGEALVALGKKNPDVVVLSADLAESTRAHLFAKEFPQRFFQVGVAEQNMMGIAAGMALAGKTPFVCSFAVFSPGRSWDQLRVSVCYSKANVKVIGSHVGFSNGGDGGTHQALEDIAMTRCLPNLAVVSPADAAETYQAVFALAEQVGPMYMRVSRSAPYHDAGWGFDPQPFHFGKANILRQGKDITLIATGVMVAEIQLASDLLAAEGIDAEVINVHTIKPLDVETLRHSLQKTKAAVSLEEHQKAGGLGSAILEALSPHLQKPLQVLAVEDTFGESGDPVKLAEKYGLTAQHVVKAAHKLLH